MDWSGKRKLTVHAWAKEALKTLGQESIPNPSKADKARNGIRDAVLKMVQHLAELRNERGVGHGRTSSEATLAEAHTAIAASCTWVTCLCHALIDKQVSGFVARYRTLSRAEEEVVQLTAQGNTAREVGLLRGTSHRTVQVQLQKATKKLDCSARELALKLELHGLRDRPKSE